MSKMRMDPIGMDALPRTKRDFCSGKAQAYMKRAFPRRIVESAADLSERKAPLPG